MDAESCYSLVDAHFIVEDCPLLFLHTDVFLNGLFKTVTNFDFDTGFFPPVSRRTLLA